MVKHFIFISLLVSGLALQAMEDYESLRQQMAGKGVASRSNWVFTQHTQLARQAGRFPNDLKIQDLQGQVLGKALDLVDCAYHKMGQQNHGQLFAQYQDTVQQFNDAIASKSRKRVTFDQ